MISKRFLSHWILPLSLAVLWVGRDSFAAAPELTSLFPSGGQRGGKVEVTLGGSFPRWPISTWSDLAGLKAQPAKTKGKLTIEIPADAQPGVYWLRVHDDEGASAPRPFVVGRLAELAEVEPNDNPKAPQKLTGSAVTINGKLERSGDVDGFAMTLKRGETLVAALEANRLLGSPMDGVLQVASSDGFVLAQVDDDPDMDPFLVFEAPQDGSYIVRVFAFPATPDSSIRFAGGANYLYRLTLTNGGYLDHVEPLALRQGAIAEVEAVGWNLSANSRRLTPRLVEGPTMVPAAVVEHDQIANTVEIPVLDLPVVRESEPPSAGSQSTQSQTQVIEGPAAISGRIDPPGDVDTYTIRGQPGQAWVVKARARSLGRPLDLAVRSSEASKSDPSAGRGQRRRRGGEAQGERDRVLNVTIPQSGELTLTIHDQANRGGPRCAYLLEIGPPRGDFTLKLAGHTFSLKPGDSLEIPITIERLNSFSQPIRIEAKGLPEGVTAAAATSAATGDSAKSVKLKLTASGQAKGGVFQIVGVSEAKEAVKHAAAADVAGLNPGRPLTALWLNLAKP